MSSLNILITGVTSFTGTHFAYELARSGHNVKGFSRIKGLWDKEQSKRIAWLLSEFPNFKIIEGNDVTKLNPKGIDLICLHGAAAQDYKSKEFNVDKAVQETFEVSNLLIGTFPDAKILHTGTFSEPNESAGEFPRVSFNPYSTSKSIIWERLAVELAGKQNLSKYIMPNPFGPLESKRLVDYLIRTWSKNEIPIITNPYYVRDNVPIDLLRMHYADTISKLFSKENNSTRFYPSMYAESVLTFVRRYINEFNKRSEKLLQVNFKLGSEYPEPMVRVNTENCMLQLEKWDESKSWDSTINDALERMYNYERE